MGKKMKSASLEELETGTEKTTQMNGETETPRGHEGRELDSHAMKRNQTKINQDGKSGRTTTTSWTVTRP